MLHDIPTTWARGLRTSIRDGCMNAVPRKRLAEQVYEDLRSIYGPRHYRPWTELGPVTRSRFLMLVTEMESVGLIDPAYPEHNP